MYPIMVAKEEERSFLQKAGEYLVSLPFDLKVLQEAMTDPDLAQEARELAAGTIIHTLAPHEGEPGPLRYFDDVLYVRVALKRVVTHGSEGVQAFIDRFGEVYEKLDEELALFERSLGDLWPWLTSKLSTFPRLVYKGKRPAQCVDDEEVASFLYEEGLEFQTNYSVTEEKVRNKLRSADQLLEILEKRRSDDLKKKP
jgi:hypothetical protein